MHKEKNLSPLSLTLSASSAKTDPAAATGHKGKGDFDSPLFDERLKGTSTHKREGLGEGGKPLTRPPDPKGPGKVS